MHNWKILFFCCSTSLYWPRAFLKYHFPKMYLHIFTAPPPLASDISYNLLDACTREKIVMIIKNKKNVFLHFIFITLWTQQQLCSHFINIDERFILHTRICGNVRSRTAFAMHRRNFHITAPRRCARAGRLIIKFHMKSIQPCHFLQRSFQFKDNDNVDDDDDDDHLAINV